MTEFTPREIVAELDRHIIGQNDAKRAVAIALRNRWRRRQLSDQLREEVYPKNILMIGPTGVGKTEIARRLAKLASAPFVKVEATKFTEVGYVGRDVDTIIRDLVEASVHLLREKRRAENRARAEANAEERVLDALVGPDASDATRQSFRRKLRAGEMNDREIEIEVTDASPALPDMGMMGGNVATIDLSAVLSKALGGRGRKRKMTVAQSHAVLLAEEADKLIDNDRLHADAVALAENDGIVFIDEIDKICARGERSGADVSREGVQRDLLPLIEGSVVNTRYGPARTDHILFICSGAFHVAQPSDLLPELQGRLPVRVELKPLTVPDFLRILTETDNNLCKQATALLSTEQISLSFAPDGVMAIAELADQVNNTVENIGARRLHTIIEKVLEDLSFEAPDRSGSQVMIDRAYVESRVGTIARDRDLSRYIL